MTKSLDTLPSSPPLSPSPGAPPVWNIWAVGRNYAEHAKELGNAAPAAHGDPMIFLKAGSCLVPSNESVNDGTNGAAAGRFRLPEFSIDIHHEAEIALQFGADRKFSGIGLALDLTAREVQSRLKEKQHPWTLAKSFIAACPISEIKPLPQDWNLSEIRFSLSVNGEVRQRGHMADMIFSADELRDYVLAHFPVVTGDLLLTGTPSGVGLLRPGDRLSGEITGPIGEAFLKTAWQVLA